MRNMGDITAVILCGGLGTRLRSVSGDLPKPMVEVAGRPFLEYILDYLIDQGVTKAVLAVSYRKEIIIEHFGNKYRNLNLSYSIELTPLGTGGAIKQSIHQLQDQSKPAILVVNGDTLVEYQLTEMLSMFDTQKADLVMSLKSMDDTSRYGRVSITDGNVTQFEEKKEGFSGLINAGVYLFNSHLLSKFPQQDSFSFENGVLEKIVHSNRVLGSVTSGYFIDIGIPEDFNKAQMDFLQWNQGRSNLEFI